MVGLITVGVSLFPLLDVPSFYFPLAFLAQKSNHHLRHDRDRRFLFDLSQISADHMVIGGELRLYKAYSWKQGASEAFTIYVHVITRGRDSE